MPTIIADSILPAKEPEKVPVLIVEFTTNAGRDGSFSCREDLGQSYLETPDLLIYDDGKGLTIEVSRSQVAVLSKARLMVNKDMPTLPIPHQPSKRTH